MSDELKKGDLQTLLDEQTRVILGAVDEKVEKVDKRLDNVDKRLDGIDSQLIGMEANFEARINRLDEKFTEKFDKIMTLLDKQAGQWSDLRGEFYPVK